MKQSSVQALLHVRYYHVERVGALNTAGAKAAVDGDHKRAEALSEEAAKHVHCLQLITQVFADEMESAKTPGEPSEGATGVVHSSPDNNAGDFVVQSGIPESGLLGSDKS